MPSSLENLSLRAQLRVDRLPLRLLVLMAGLTLFGISVAMLVHAGLGAAPWDVLHVALAERTGLSLGLVIILTSANSVWVGISTDVTLALLPPVHGMPAAIALLVGGVLLNAVAGALYIGAQLGAGPRDGLMTGVHRRTGLPVGPVRIGVEIAVLATGWALGGPLGVGTLVYALAIGPLVQLVLPWATIPVRRGGRPGPDPEVTAGAA